MKYSVESQRLFRKVYAETFFHHLSKVTSRTATSTDRLDKSLQDHLYGEINEFYVFHGTKADVVNVILNQGLDSRLASGGLLGQGVYGAEDSGKSHGYASKF